MKPQSNASDPEFRKSGLGGSDMAVVAGLHPHKSPYELYLEKRGELAPSAPDRDASMRMMFGNLFEDAIAQGYCVVRGEREGRPIRLRRDHITMTSAEFAWAFAHIDRRVVGEHRGLEIKNVGPYAYFESWGDEGTDQVPDHMLIQCQWYMWITGYTTWDLAALHGGNDLRIYTLRFDPEIARALCDAGAEFWFHVEHSQPPAPDWAAASTRDLLKRVYAQTTGEILFASPDVQRWHEMRLEALDLMKAYKGAVDAAENHIRHAMGEASVLKLADGSGYTRKSVSRKGYEVQPTTYIDLRYRRRMEKVE